MRLMPTRLVITETGPNSVALAGEIDAHSAPQIAERFHGLVGDDDIDDDIEIVIEMADVTFMDSSGLRVLIELQQRADAATRRLVLRAPSKSVTRLFEVSGLTEHFSIEP